jgi:hypothetical protein
MTNPRIVAGALLVAVPVVFTVGFSVLQMGFEYPDILRHPASEVLTKFAAVGADVHLAWYAMMAAALGLMPAAVALGVYYWRQDALLASLTAAFGVVAGLVQALGLLRWVILVPTLATNFVAAGGSDIDRAIAAAQFDFANHYLGAGVGEHLGYLFTGLFTLSLAGLIWSRHRYLAPLAVLIAAGVIVGMAEPFGVPFAGTVNTLSFTLWALWMLVFGIAVLRSDRAPTAVAIPA